MWKLTSCADSKRVHFCCAYTLNLLQILTLPLKSNGENLQQINNERLLLICCRSTDLRFLFYFLKHSSTKSTQLGVKMLRTICSIAILCAGILKQPLGYSNTVRFCGGKKNLSLPHPRKQFLL